MQEHTSFKRTPPTAFDQLASMAAGPNGREIHRMMFKVLGLVAGAGWSKLPYSKLDRRDMVVPAVNAEGWDLRCTATV